MCSHELSALIHPDLVSWLDVVLGIASGTNPAPRDLIEHLRQEGGENHPLLADARKLLADMHEFQELGQEHLEREKAKEV